MAIFNPGMIEGEEVNREEERGWDDLVEDLPIDEGFDDDDGDEIYVQTFTSNG
jgi:hypothetical protein